MTHIDFIGEVMQSIIFHKGENFFKDEMESIIHEIEGNDISSIALDSGDCGSIVFCKGRMHFCPSSHIWKAYANKGDEDNYVWVIDSPKPIFEGEDLDFSEKFLPDSQEYKHVMMLLDAFRL